MPKKRTLKYKRKKYRKRRLKRKTVYKAKRYRAVKGNPGWNPQYFKIKRTFQYSGPTLDVGSNGILTEDLYVLSNDIDTTNATSYNYYGLTFKASDIPNLSSYSNRYDQYMLVGVSLRFEYLNATMSPLQTNSSLDRIKMLIWNDYDDVTSIGANVAGWQKCLEIGRAKGYAFPNNFKNQVKFYIRPKILVPAVDASSGTTARKVARSCWLDGATASDALHYGCKILLQANPQKQPEYHYFRMTATYYIKFKQRKET